jgi:hypothetical protein
MANVRFGGLLVFVTCDTPRYQLPADLPLPEGFREEFNDWARRELGHTNKLPDSATLVIGNRIYMNPRTYAHMKKEAGNA